MKIEESLTKENFWNEIEQKYPNAFKVFSDWIDEYKKEVGWDTIFPIIRLDNESGNGYKEYQIKFHNLPHAM